MTIHPAPAPHGPVKEILPGLWFAPSTAKMSKPPIRISRNMVVVRGTDGLVLLNPVRLDEQAECELLALGPIKHALRLGTFHGCDDTYYVDKFGAELWAAAGVQKYLTPAVTREIEEDKPLPIPNARAVVFKKAIRAECVVLLPEHRLLVTCDSVQNYKKDDRLSALARVVMLPMGFFKPCVIGPLWLKDVTPPGGSIKSDFERVLELDFDNLISGHGTPKLGGAKDALRKQVARLAS